MALYLSDPQLAAASDPASYRNVVGHSRHGVATATTGWRCHIDVLDTASLPAVDWRQPDGLSWTQLEKLTAAC